MLGEIVIVGCSLAALGMGVGLFILPDVKRALLCFMGLSLAVAGFLLASRASTVAWAVLLCGSSSCAALLSVKEPANRGWQNWFVIVVTASTLWLLSLFLLWTLEEALAIPIAEVALPPSAMDVFLLCFDRLAWPLLLLGCLVVTLGFTVASRRAE